jgi:hypothetical protein
MNHNETTQTGRNVGHIIGAILLIVLAACNAPGDEPLSTDATLTATKAAIESPTVTEAASRNWVIIEKRRAEELGVASWLSQSEGFWTPSTDDILELEMKIGEYLHENSGQFHRQPSIWERLDEYRRQYVGYEIGGKRIIHGNFFCSYEDVDWQRQFVMALDGGECYFQVDYDVESESFIRLRVHGEA